MVFVFFATDNEGSTITRTVGADVNNADEGDDGQAGADFDVDCYIKGRKLRLLAIGRGKGEDLMLPLLLLLLLPWSALLLFLHLPLLLQVQNVIPRTHSFAYRHLLQN